MVKHHLSEIKNTDIYKRIDISDEELKLLPGRSNINNRTTFQYWNRTMGITLEEVLHNIDLTPEEYLNENYWTNPFDTYASDMNYYHFSKIDLIPRNCYRAGLEILQLNSPLILSFYRLIPVFRVLKYIQQTSQRFNREYIITSEKINSQHFRLKYTPYPYKLDMSTGQECHFINGVLDANYLLHEVGTYQTKHIFCHQRLQNILRSLSVQGVIQWEERDGGIYVGSRKIAEEISFKEALRRNSIDIKVENSHFLVFRIMEDLFINREAALYKGEIYNAPYCLIDTKWETTGKKRYMIKKLLSYFFRNITGSNKVANRAIQEREIAAMKALEAKTIALNTSLKAEKERRELLLRLGHEVKNPLHSILNLIDLSLKQRINSDAKKYLNLAFHSGERLSRLIKGILETDDLKSDLKLSDRENINIVPLICDVWEHFKLLNINSKINWVLDLPQTTSLVFGEEDKINQILFNLLENAAKYTIEGTIEVRLQESEKIVEIMVSDTGSGIPKELKEKVFDQYFQNNSANDGLGIGLSITRHLVRNHGGRIWIESEKNRGTSVFFTLPRGSEKKLQSSLSLIKESDKPIPCIWYIDDEYTNRLILRKNLSKYVLDQKEFSNGKDCLEQLKISQPDILLLDLIMPGMDGFSILKKIRKQWDSTSLPVCVLSARSSQEDIQKAFKLGANDFISKPILAYDMEHRLQNLYQNQNEQIKEDRIRQRYSNFNLSARELDCCALAAEGLTNRDIGEKLSIKEATVKRHLYNSFNKIGCSTRAELIRDVLR